MFLNGFLTPFQIKMVSNLYKDFQKNFLKMRISMTLVPYKVACLSAQVGPAPLTQCQSVYFTRKSDLGLDIYNTFQKSRQIFFVLFTFILTPFVLTNFSECLHFGRFSTVYFIFCYHSAKNWMDPQVVHLKQEPKR